jgi:energy-coupling factor transport system substrate-specific component
MKGYGRLTIFMIPIGIAINIVGGQIAILLKLPLYLDSVGTILIGALCGSIPGAIVGGVSNVLNSLTYPMGMVYSVLSIGFGLLAGWLARAGFFRSWAKALATAPIFAVIGGVLGACITLALYGGFSGSGTDFITTSLVAAGVPITTAVFMAAVPVDLIDKIPTVVLVYLIIGRISVRLMSKMPLGYVYLRGKVPSRPVAQSSASTTETAGA